MRLAGFGDAAGVPGFLFRTAAGFACVGNLVMLLAFLQLSTRPVIVVMLCGPGSSLPPPRS